MVNLERSQSMSFKDQQKLVYMRMSSNCFPKLVKSQSKAHLVEVISFSMLNNSFGGTIKHVHKHCLS